VWLLQTRIVMSMSCDTSILLIMRQKMRIRLVKPSKKHNHLVFELPFNVALCISSRIGTLIFYIWDLQTACWRNLYGIKTSFLQLCKCTDICIDHLDSNTWWMFQLMWEGKNICSKPSQCLRLPFSYG
jgi:hypothetical protein